MDHHHFGYITKLTTSKKNLKKMSLSKLIYDYSNAIVTRFHNLIRIICTGGKKLINYQHGGNT